MKIHYCDWNKYLLLFKFILINKLNKINAMIKKEVYVI